jgi:hypothetical protein
MRARLGDGPLAGDGLVRITYLDEAGIGKIEQDPILVVAGVILDPDLRWKEVDAYFRSLACDLFPDDDPYEFIFHAKDVWHGSGPFDRARWPRRERLKVMYRLAQVPQLFDLPVVFGAVNREIARDHLGAGFPERAARVFSHCRAFVEAIRRVEYWMENQAPNETTMLIVEDTDDLKSALQPLHKGYTAPDAYPDTFHAPHVVDAVVFAKKRESILLQVADHCAFMARYNLMGKTEIDPFFDLIAPKISAGRAGGEGIIGVYRPDQITLVSDENQ